MLLRGGLGQHCVKNNNIRNVQTIDKGQQVFTAFSAVDAKFMLDDQQIGIRIVEEIGRIYIICVIMLVDLPYYLLIVSVGFIVVYGNNPGRVEAGKVDKFI
ncbi:hypothetical protein D3C76_1026140 [compost metagenome]